MEQETKVIKHQSSMGHTLNQEAVQEFKTPEERKIYYLDNPEDAKYIKDYYLSKPNFRIIKLYDKYFLQYKTMQLHKSMYDVLEEVVRYEKLKDDYYFDNERGFNSIEEATTSLLTYMNAPQNATLHEVKLSAKEEIILNEVKPDLG